MPDSNSQSDPTVNISTAMLLIRGGRVASEMLESEFSKVGLSLPYAVILAALLENGSRTATDLCTLTMRERANMSVLLSKLHKTGYITESPNPLDARSHLIGLTPQGEKTAVICRDIIVDTSRIVDQFLVEEEKGIPSRFRPILINLTKKFYSINI